MERVLEVDENLDSHSLLLKGDPSGIETSAFTLGENYYPTALNISYHFRKYKPSWKISSLTVGERFIII